MNNEQVDNKEMVRGFLITIENILTAMERGRFFHAGRKLLGLKQKMAWYLSTFPAEDKNSETTKTEDSK